MQIEKVESNETIENFIEEEQEKYEDKNGVVCNYTPFCFTAQIDNELVGAIAGATCFSEVYIDELVVKEVYRGKNIGSKLINAVEDYWKNIISAGKEEYGDGFSLGYTFPIDDDTYAYCINDDKIDLHKIANSYEHLMTFKDKATLLKLEEQLDFDFIVHDGVKIGLWFKPLDDSLIERLLK